MTRLRDSSIGSRTTRTSMSRARAHGSSSATATRDREAFDEVMDAEAPVDHEALRHSAARVVRAHEYFTGAVIGVVGLGR